MADPFYKPPPARKPGNRLMAHGYVPVLRSIFQAGHRGMTWKSLAGKHFAGRRLSAQKAVEDMETVGLVHVAHWTTERVDKRQLPMAHYVFGKGVSAPHPGYANGSPRKKEGRRKPLIGLIVLALAIEILKENEHHGASFASEIGIGNGAARKLLKALHEHRFAFHSDYARRSDGGVQCPLFSFGINKPDAPRPPPTPEIEHWRKHNANRAARRRALHALGMSNTTRVVRIADLGFTYSMAAEAA